MKLKGNMIGKLFRWIVLSFKKLLRLRDSTHQISLGFAIGVFVGILPTLGFGALILAGLALVIRFNFFSALVGTLVNNPLFVPFWVASSYKVGELITKIGINFSEKSVLQNMFGFGLSFAVGNIVLAVLSGFLSYFVMFLVIEIYRASRNNSSKSESKTQE
ncbi:MAG: DUF2062 domain-containing protein [Brevinematales bacterium]|nr:DUF2062 domain-containing protein [Brevinematales bacterium]